MKLPQMQQGATPRNKAELRQLTPMQLQVAQLVAVGSSDEEIANRHGLNRSTVYRWRIFSPLFQADVNRHRAVLNAQISDKLRESVFGAVDTIAQLMAKSADETIKLKAASMLLGLMPLSIQVGPTDPREIVRPIAEQRDRDTPRDCDRIIHQMDGTKPIQEVIRKVLIELEVSANDTSGEPDGTTASSTENPDAPHSVTLATCSPTPNGREHVHNAHLRRRRFHSHWMAL